MNSKEKRIIKRAPATVQTIMQKLPVGWKLERAVTQYMGWVADLSYKNMKFRLVQDGSYIGVYAMKDGKEKIVETIPGQSSNNSISHIQPLLEKGIREWGD